MGYSQILGLFRHLVCPDVRYVQTLGMFRHWVCSYIRSEMGYFQTLGTIINWVCSVFRYITKTLINYFISDNTLWLAHMRVGNKIYFLRFFTIEVFQGFLFSVCHACASPPVLKFGIFIHWAGSDIGFVQTKATFRHWFIGHWSLVIG